MKFYLLIIEVTAFIDSEVVAWEVTSKFVALTFASDDEQTMAYAIRKDSAFIYYKVISIWKKIHFTIIPKVIENIILSHEQRCCCKNDLYYNFCLKVTLKPCIFYYKILRLISSRNFFPMP